MRLIRYLTMLMAFVLSATAWGQNTDDFNPDSPGEPTQPVVPDEPTPPDDITYYQLTLLASEGGTITAGAGKHAAQEKVTVTASAPAQNFVFVCWTTLSGDTIKVEAEGGKPVMAGRSFSYTMPDRDVTLVAHYDFQPGAPAEPTQPDIEMPETPDEPVTCYTLQLLAGEGGTITAGAGSYEAGTVVTVTASAAAVNFRFAGWTTVDGDTVKVASADGTDLVPAGRSFTYTMPSHDVCLVAHYEFEPGSPAEPTEPNLPIVDPDPEPKPRHLFTLVGEEGGVITLNGKDITGLRTTVEIEEEAKVDVNTSLSANFVFAGWYSADTLYTTSRSFTFVMDAADHVFRARYDYQPGSPAEPAMPTTQKQELYLMSVIGLPGETINYPLYLNSNDTIRDILFEMQFPRGMTPDFEHASISPQAKGYTFTYHMLDLGVKAQVDTQAAAMSEGIYDSNYNVYEISMTGGTTPPGNTALLIVPLEIDENISQERHRVWLSQVEVMNNDGTVETATTRNGAINTDYVEPDSYSFLDNLICVGSSVWEITQTKQFDPPTPQVETYDMAAVAQLLGCSSTAFITFKGRAGEAKVTDDLTADNGFWYNKAGYVCSDEDVNRAMSVVYDADQSSIVFTQYPGAYESGEQTTIRVYFTYKYKYYEVEMRINIIGKDYYLDHTSEGVLVVHNPNGMLQELLDDGEDLRELVVTGHLTADDVNYLGSLEHLLALHWNCDEELPASLPNSMIPNQIIYVKAGTPIEGGFDNSQNVVQDGWANALVLTDGHPLLIPLAFTASTATYSKLFDQQNVQGRASGWRTIVLPYDVQTFTEEGSEATIAPFGASATADKRFWLAGLTDEGFAHTDKLEANVPYLIAVPNSANYKEELNISGQVRFESRDVLVQATTDARTTTDNQYVFVPAYEPASVAKAYTINDAPYRSYPAGSVFVRDYRDVRPFEGYLMLAPQMKYTPYIKVDDMMLDQTDIIPQIADTDAGSLGVYNLNGQRLQSAKSLPTGIYIVNRKKVVVK